MPTPTNTRRFVRYAATGAMAFVTDMAVTLATVPFMHYLLANTLGFVVANAAQFAVAHTWVVGRSFADEDLLRIYLTTLAISGLGLAVSDGIVFVGVGVAGVPLVLSKVAAAGIVLVLNFSLRRVTAYR